MNDSPGARPSVHANARPIAGMATGPVHTVAPVGTPRAEQAEWAS
jgi:hypothetical protein